MDKEKKAKRLTVRFSKRLKSEMQLLLIKSGYGLHGKSRWLKETLHVFLQQPNYIDYVEHGTNLNQADLTVVEAFSLDALTHQLIKDSLVKIRIKYPLFEGVQSALVRSAIIYRLMLK